MNGMKDVRAMCEIARDNRNPTCQKPHGDITFRERIFRMRGGHLVHPSASEQK